MNIFLIWMATMLCVMADLHLEEGSNILQSKGFTTFNDPYKPLYSEWESVHGYVQVRPGAHIFYWLFYADGTKMNAARKPLVIWIQGGPGFAASGVGNFAEIGPFDMNLKPRNHTWVKKRNVLFIDHPVGSGFSYATNSSLYVKTDREMAMDLSIVIKTFLRRHKEFRKTPAYLFGQSYGGKACPRLGLYLHTAIERNSLKMNFKGIGIGGGWVDPKESTAVQAKFLYFSGAIDRNLYLKSSRLAKKLVRSIEQQDFFTAHALDSVLYGTLNSEGVINFNNVFAPSPYPALEELNLKVNNHIKPTLIGVNQSRTWQYLSITAYNHLKENFLVSSTSFLETLLNKTKLKIAVYNGNLDVVTPLAGACNWVHKLKWPGAAEFSKAKRYPIRGNNNGFYKETKNLSFWWIYGAGHWIPEENPEAMEHILQYVMAEDEDKSN